MKIKQVIDQEAVDAVSLGLKKFGAGLSPNPNGRGYLINKGEKVFGVVVLFWGRRLRVELNERLIFSGGQTAEAIETFVRRYWFWEAVK